MDSYISYRVVDSLNGIAINLDNSVPSEHLGADDIDRQVSRMKLAVKHFALVTGLSQQQQPPVFCWEDHVDATGGHCNIWFEGKEATSDPLDAALEATDGAHIDLVEPTEA